jgi:hypothetical protein
MRQASFFGLAFLPRTTFFAVDATLARCFLALADRLAGAFFTATFLTAFLVAVVLGDAETETFFAMMEETPMKNRNQLPIREPSLAYGRC